MRKSGKQILLMILAAVLILQPSWKVLAEEVQTDQNVSEEAEMTEEEKQAAEEKEKQESYETVPDTNVIKDWPQGPNIYGASAIVIDMDSGAVLYEKRADEKQYPASITKLLTTLVALENGELADEIIFSEDSISFLEYGDASIGMTPGEILTLEEALYGVLLASANEVSYAVAENIGQKMGGGYAAFIQKMNDRSIELGCTRSHWVNANGLHDEEHYTTAHDMALIASAVYKKEVFQTIMQSLSYTIPPTNLMEEERVLWQNHKMLWPENYYYYAYCTGGKTGYTDQAKTTLVTMADNGSMRLAAVVLHDYGVSVYDDTRAMLDYAFENFTRLPLTVEENTELKKNIGSFKDNAYVTVPLGVTLSDLESEITIMDEKDRTGFVTYTYKGENVGNAHVQLTKEYMTSQGSEQDIKIEQKESEEKKSPEAGDSDRNIKAIVSIGIASILLALILMIGMKYRKI
ncbi:D-alanyl-D-alanine carboxypeptidase [Faecalicatena acetigenes]|uniref:D-alanyl-D-alanine carboxypeptidase n=1 Tax=Faecalicatena acetigenes TaxID=2981790 RepID=A0ABT2TER8_9FIRM|nr:MULTISPECIES: D-alanyl-D-alanine carboxypeptidase family protein [Lachnospiraceae]MCU6748778.1 D-alanyl-D-alanine carboxypeptidase [Faecalicatena acetigenes]SCI64934.1 D-alanyl-D-alanine carboxypeptidase dacB precursor [uncultured Clostridium sp.]